MDKKIVAIIFLVTGLVLATLYWVYPPFTLAIVGGAMWFATFIYTQFMYAPIHIIVTATLTALLAIGIVKGFFKAVRFGNRQVAQNMGLQTAPTTVMPVGVGTTMLPLTEKEKVAA